MGTRNDLLSWASDQVGHVGGAKYWYDAYGWSGNGLPWCAVFCTDALEQTGTSCAYFPSTVAFDIINDRARIGSAFVDKWSLQAGDFLSFDWDKDGSGDHVGIVEDVIGNGVYRTIEGNVSNSVGRRTRYASDIICGIRPRYEHEEEGEVYAFKQIKRGDSGAEVMLLQSALNIRQGSNFALDGEFGSYTESEVKRWQRSHGIYPDGICGKKTWPSLLGA